MTRSAPRAAARSASPGGRRRVGQDAAVDDLGVEAMQQGGQHRPVGVVHLARPQRRRRGRDFVAGGEHRDAQPAAHLGADKAQGGEQADIGRHQAPAGGQRERAAGDVLAGRAAVGAAADAGLNGHAAGLDAAVLLHHHRVGAVGHDRAGEDAQRMAAGQRAGRRGAGGGAAVQGQRGRRVRREVVEMQGDAVHRGIVGGRQVERRDRVMRQNPADGGGQGDRLDARLHRMPGEDARLRLGERQQGAAESETIVAELSHQGARSRWVMRVSGDGAGGVSSGRQGQGSALDPQGAERPLDPIL